MLPVFIQHCPGTHYGMVAHVVARHFLSFSDAFPHASQIRKSVLFGLGAPD
jgi:hypothetical protein